MIQHEIFGRVNPKLAIRCHKYLVFVFSIILHPHQNLSGWNMLRDDGIPKLFFDMFSRIQGSDDQLPMCLNGFTFTLELLSQSAWHGEGLFRKCQCQEKIGIFPWQQSVATYGKSIFKRMRYCSWLLSWVESEAVQVCSPKMWVKMVKIKASKPGLAFLSFLAFLASIHPSIRVHLILSHAKMLRDVNISEVCPTSIGHRWASNGIKIEYPKT